VWGLYLELYFVCEMRAGLLEGDKGIDMGIIGFVFADFDMQDLLDKIGG
jgi:hypothetical protein